MFDFDASKLLIVGVIALIFIPPKDLPRVLRQVGQFVGKMRRMASEFQGQFMDAMREADMADLRKEAQKLADAARIDTGLDSVHDIDRHMSRSDRSNALADEATGGEPTPIEPKAAKPAAHPEDGTSVDFGDARAFDELRNELTPLIFDDEPAARQPGPNAAQEGSAPSTDPAKRILQTVPPDGA